MMDELYKVPKIKDLPPEEKPREKLIKYGPQALKNYELMAVILGRGTRKEGVLEIAQRIISQYSNHAIFTEGDVKKVEKVLGLSPVQACQVVAVFELGKRLFGKPTDVFLRSPQEVYEYVRDMERYKKELLRGLYLDVRNKLIRDEIISIGTLEASLAHPREIFYPAVESHAASIILVHNHPSGDPTPSQDDVKLTQRILKVSKLMEIELLDHIIVGHNTYYSMHQNTDIWENR